MLQYNYSLKAINSFSLDCEAAKYTAIKTKDELSNFIENSYVREEKLLVLGGGSNILFTENYDGHVLHNKIKGFRVLDEDNTHVSVQVGAGEVWHEFVLKSIENNWGGLENLSLIPGTVGASPIQNIGAYGVEVKDVITSVEAVEVSTNETKIFTKKSCNFKYRDSIFKNKLKGQYIISNVTFKLSKKHTLKYDYGAIIETLNEEKIKNPTLKNISDAIIKIRSNKLPNPEELGNAGSFFKNPEIKTSHFEKLKENNPTIVGYKISELTTKVPAGWLIEDAGWKGKTFGSIGVHKNQALVLVNYGGGTGIEIKKLAQTIKEDIYSKYDIKLQVEVNII